MTAEGGGILALLDLGRGERRGEDAHEMHGAVGVPLLRAAIDA